MKTTLTNGTYTHIFTAYGNGGVKHTKTFGPKNFVVSTGAFTANQAAVVIARLIAEGYVAA